MQLSSVHGILGPRPNQPTPGLPLHIPSPDEVPAPGRLLLPRPGPFHACTAGKQPRQPRQPRQPNNLESDEFTEKHPQLCSRASRLCKAWAASRKKRRASFHKVQDKLIKLQPTSPMAPNFLSYAGTNSYPRILRLGSHGFSSMSHGQVQKTFSPDVVLQRILLVGKIYRKPWFLHVFTIIIWGIPVHLFSHQPILGMVGWQSTSSG